MDVLCFILAASGLTQILVYGSLFDGVRPVKGKLGDLFRCSMCMGFWSGVFLFGINKYTELFTFEYNFINAFICGCIAAGTSYFITMLLDDFGLKINRRGGEL